MNTSISQVSEILIKYQPKVKPVDRPKIQTSQAAYFECLKFLDPDMMNIKEEAVVLFLKNGGRVLGGYKISSGGITGTVVDIRLILAIALKSLATGLILAHTHPSGELIPSRADKEVTFKIKEAAKWMDITLHDHLIITYDGYFSFADEGII
jgi:DNA repair protein RadC